MSSARARAATAWGAAPAVVTAPAEGDAAFRPHPAVEPALRSGTAWAAYEAAPAADLRATLRLNERQQWAETISEGIVTYPHEVERSWVTAVPGEGDTETS